MDTNEKQDPLQWFAGSAHKHSSCAIRFMGTARFMGGSQVQPLAALWFAKPVWEEDIKYKG